MKKILISLIMVFMLIMQIPCVFAYEYTPYVGDGVISVTPVKMIYEKEVSEFSFEEVDDITDATIVTASCNVKTGTEYDGSEVKVSLVVVGYKGKFLRSFNSESMTFTSADEGVKKLTTQQLVN